MFNEFEEDIPERFSFGLIDGKCHAVWLSDKQRANVGYQFEIGYIIHGDRPTSVFSTFEITEVVPESLGAFIHYYWNAGGFTSEPAAADYYYGAGYSDFYALDGFVYTFKKVK